MAHFLVPNCAPCQAREIASGQFAAIRTAGISIGCLVYLAVTKAYTAKNQETTKCRQVTEIAEIDDKQYQRLASFAFNEAFGRGKL